MQVATRQTGGGIRQDALMALAETAAIFLIFIVAFTGRDAIGDSIKTLLTILSVVAGLLGTVGAAIVARRGLADSSGRFARFGIAGWMAFAGIYTVVHVLS